MENNMKYVKLYENWASNDITDFTKDDYDIDEFFLMDMLFDSIGLDTDDLKKEYPHLNESSIYFDKTSVEEIIDNFVMDQIDPDEIYDVGVYWFFNYEDNIVVNNNVIEKGIFPQKSSDANNDYLLYFGYIKSLEITPDCKVTDLGELFHNSGFIEDGKAMIGKMVCIDNPYIEKFNYKEKVDVVNITGCKNLREVSGIRGKNIELVNNNIITVENIDFQSINLMNNNLLYLSEFLEIKYTHTEYLNLTNNPILVNPYKFLPKMNLSVSWSPEKTLSLLKERKIDYSYAAKLFDNISDEEKNIITMKVIVTEEEAKLYWYFIENVLSDLIPICAENCTAVGNWIPPDLLARMKKYDHSEYRDSKLDSEWKDVF